MIETKDEPSALQGTKENPWQVTGVNTQRVVERLIHCTSKNGWETTLHCTITAGLGESLAARCKVFISRARGKNRRHRKVLKHFKLAIRIMQAAESGQDVVVFWFYQTRYDKLADETTAMMETLNSIDSPEK